MMRRIGRQGEQFFALLCANAGVTCNPSQHDDFGWDHLIEYPPPTSKLRKALDLQPPPTRAFVQVKSTEARKRSCRIKLSNALRMANSLQPFFVVLVALNADGEPRTYVVHVWDKLIRQFLKAGRLADNRGQLATHKQQISIKFEESDLQTDPVGWISEQLSAIGSDYAAAKKELVDHVGFEGGYGTAQVQVELDASEDFFDLLLGRKESLRLLKFVFTSERFGIPAGVPETDAEHGMLYVTPPVRKGTLRLMTADGESLLQSADVTSVGGPGWAYDDLRLRVVAACLEIVWAGNGASSINVSLKLDERVPLAHISYFYDLMALMERGPLGVTLYLDGKDIRLGTIEFPSRKVQPAEKEFHSGILAIEKVVSAANENDIRISISDVQIGKPGLHFLNALVQAPTLLLTTHNPEIQKNIAGMLSYTAIQVGEWGLAALAFRPAASDVQSEDGRRIYFNPARLVEARVEQGVSTEELLIQFEVKYYQAMDRMASLGEVLGIGELQSFVRDGMEAASE